MMNLPENRGLLKMRLCSALLMALLVSFSPVFARERPSPPVIPKPELPQFVLPAPPAPPGPVSAFLLRNEKDRVTKDAMVMLGHIGIAQITLLHELYPEAVANVKSALAVVRKLETKTEQFTSSEPVKMARLSYRSGAEEKTFLIPIPGDNFAVRTMDDKFTKARRPQVKASDAMLGRNLIKLVVKDIRLALEKAETALSQKNYGEADQALEQTMRSVYEEKSESRSPAEQARAYLLFARELARDRNYVSALFALGHARETIGQWQSAVPALAKNARLKDIQSQIISFQQFSQKDKPTSLKNMEQAIGRWLQTLDAVKKR